MRELQIGIGVVCGLVALMIVVALVRDRRPGQRTVSGLLAIELGLLLNTVLGVVRLFNEGAGVSRPTYLGYLLATLLTLPIAWVWSDAERNRGGTTVLLIGVLLVPFFFLRLAQVWGAGA